MRPGALNELLSALSRRAGLAREIHPHMLRHGFGSNVMDAGGALDEAQALLGHASPSSTQVYRHFPTTAGCGTRSTRSRCVRWPADRGERFPCPSFPGSARRTTALRISGITLSRLSSARPGGTRRPGLSRPRRAIRCSDTGSASSGAARDRGGCPTDSATPAGKPGGKAAWAMRSSSPPGRPAAGTAERPSARRAAAPARSAPGGCSCALRMSTAAGPPGWRWKTSCGTRERSRCPASARAGSRSALGRRTPGGGSAALMMSAGGVSIAPAWPGPLISPRGAGQAPRSPAAIRS